MTHKTEQYIEEMRGQEILAKPPPSVTEQEETPLFLIMDELLARQQNSASARNRLYLWGVGFLIGSMVFGLFYLMILFLE
jgi:hypothetical protein